MSKRDHGVPASSWWAGLQPGTPTSTTNQYVGAAFQLQSPGRMFGVALFRQLSDTKAHWAHVVDAATNELLRSYHFKNVVGPDTGGWQNAWIRPALRMDPAKSYYVMIAYPGGGWSRLSNQLPLVRNGINMLNSFQTTQFDPTTGGWTLNFNANSVDILVQFD